MFRQDRRPASVPGENDSQQAAPSAAYLGYEYPPKITRGEAKIFYAYVTIVDSDLLIRENLQKDAVNTEGPASSADTIIIYPQNISFYRSVHLSLTSPTGDFQITPSHRSDTQLIDVHYGSYWQWTLTTQTDKSTAQLLLKAEGLRSEGAPDQLDTRMIPIRILVQPNVFRTIFLYLTDHPTVSVPALIAFIGFIGWLIKHFLSKGKSDSKT